MESECSLLCIISCYWTLSWARWIQYTISLYFSPSHTHTHTHTQTSGLLFLYDPVNIILPSKLGPHEASRTYLCDSWDNSANDELRANIILLDITSSCLYLKILSRLFFKTQRFGDWILSPSAGKTYLQLGPIDRASPCLLVSETLCFEKINRMVVR
jgi:hypothetical protein